MKWLTLIALLFLTGCEPCCAPGQIVTVDGQTYICVSQNRFRMDKFPGELDGTRSCQAESD